MAGITSAVISQRHVNHSASQRKSPLFSTIFTSSDKLAKIILIFEESSHVRTGAKTTDPESEKHNARLARLARDARKTQRRSRRHRSVSVAARRAYGKLIIYNRRWGAMLGYQPKELSAQFDVWRDHLHPEDKQQVLDAFYDHLHGKTPSTKRCTDAA
jgi:PAS domain-containing protein